MIITETNARSVAGNALEHAGYSITDYVGYYDIWVDDADSEKSYAVAISKAKDGEREYFDIYISPSHGDGYWAHTETLKAGELAEKLVLLAKNAEREEARKAK